MREKDRNDRHWFATIREISRTARDAGFRLGVIEMMDWRIERALHRLGATRIAPLPYFSQAIEDLERARNAAKLVLSPPTQGAPDADEEAGARDAPPAGDGR